MKKSAQGKTQRGEIERERERVKNKIERETEIRMDEF